jgi:hypothetical protein
LGGKKQLHFVKRKKNSKSPIEYFKFQETYWSPKLGIYIYQHIWSHIQYIDEYAD